MYNFRELDSLSTASLSTPSLSTASLSTAGLSTASLSTDRFIDSQFTDSPFYRHPVYRQTILSTPSLIMIFLYKFIKFTRDFDLIRSNLRLGLVRLGQNIRVG
jgi:hypothetical protein